jgi:hypothetical protein
MSLLKPTKKKKVDHECRVFKEFNIKRRYDARHKAKYDVFQGQVTTNKSKSLQRALLDQQNTFKSRVNEN